jgi:hypothetical protein
VSASLSTAVVAMHDPDIRPNREAEIPCVLICEDTVSFDT